jgi:ribosomal protein S14
MMRACHRCGRPTRESSGICPPCTEAYRSAGQRPYDDAAWKRRSASFLRANRKCAICGEPSRVADHWPRTRKELLAAGVLDPDLPGYLRPLCLSCHPRHGRRSIMRFDNDPA